MVCEKLSSKLILSSSERAVFQKKIVPFTLLGCIVWMAGQVCFWLFFQNPYWLGYMGALIFTMVFLEVFLFAVCYTAARHQMNHIEIPLYLLFAFIAGIFTTPLLLITEKFNVYIYSAFSFGIGACVITFYMCLFFRENFFEHGYFKKHVIIFIKSIVLLEGTLIVSLNITSVPTIIASFIFMSVTTLTFLLCGAMLSKKISEEYWLVWALQTLIFLLIAIIYVVVILILIVLLILAATAGEGIDIDIDVDLPSLGNFAEPSMDRVKLHEKVQGYTNKKGKKYAKDNVKKALKQARKNYKKEPNQTIQFTADEEFKDLIKKYSAKWAHLNLTNDSL